MSDTTFIADFCDKLSSEDKLSNDEQPSQKRLHINLTWLKEVTYHDSSKKAEQFVQQKNIWKITSSIYTPSGKRVTYHSTAGKYRMNECPAGLYLLYHSENQRVSIYCTTNSHANHVTDPGRGFSAKLKIFIGRSIWTV